MNELLFPVNYQTINHYPSRLEFCPYCSTLPAKSVAEQRRHEAQYLALIEATKRQEAKRVRQRQQLLEMKRKEEDKTAAAAEVWRNRILPSWENMYVIQLFDVRMVLSLGSIFLFT